MYRYGFNGKENDKDISEGGQDYGMRIYDGRLGRFLSVDPLTKEYPWNSTYAFAENDPINFIDLDGLEKAKKGNILPNCMIILMTQSDVKILANVPSSQGTFKIIKATNISDAYKAMKKYYGKNKVNNLVLSTHGSSTPGIIGTRPTKEEGKMVNSIHFDNIKNYLEGNDDKLSTEDLDDVTALQSMLKLVKNGGTFVTDACMAGEGKAGKELINQISELAFNTLTIYLNQDYSEQETNEKKEIDFSKPLSNTKLNKGWIKKEKGGKNIQHIKDKNHNGDIKIDPTKTKKPISELPKISSG